MRLVATGLMSALLLIGCSDDDTSAPTPAKDGSVADASSIDAGRSDAGLASDASVGGALASATLVPKSGSMTTGSASFRLVDGVVTLTLDVSGAPAGEHGVHLHVTGDCSAENASSAGGHWNPDGHLHGSGGLDAGATSHLGDLGNITIGDDGKGTLTHSNPEWKLGDGSSDDVVGRAIIVHKDRDDLMTQEQADASITPGKSGARISCGVVGK
ncbi:MAG: Superoxide dismutase precursor [Myxococcaceae bacterium]|nr:Superoxide dismutase precursor [Myxococcaceae bacterium]